MKHLTEIGMTLRGRESNPQHDILFVNDQLKIKTTITALLLDASKNH